MRKQILTHVPCARPVHISSAHKEHENTVEEIEWVYPNHNETISSLPILRLADGAIWDEGTAFLISRLYDIDFKRIRISTETVSRKADDLAYYMNALEVLNIDYRADERFKTCRPTYAFIELLAARVQNFEIVKNSALRIAGVVVEFYRWRSFSLQTDSIYPLWRESIKSRSTFDHMGIEIRSTYITTDLSETIKKIQATSEDKHIRDGGLLKPLVEKQQEILIEALFSLNKVEMTLGFLLALECAGRIQTIFTLRARYFKERLHEKNPYARIFIGKGTDVDNKQNKKHYIDVPAWLYEKIRIYVNSPRYLERSSSCQIPTEKKYLFYTNEGNPYYTAKNDISNKPRKGNAVRVFMTEELLPKISLLGHDFRFRFHDLRATYCCNRLDEGLKKVENGELSLDSVMRGLQDAMGHNDIRITYRYLDYRGLNPVIESINKEWESKILTDIFDRLGLPR